MAIRLDDVDLDRDRALVQRFQAGDRAAFDELYGRYRHRLERFCLKRVGDHHAAEEVAQEAFTRALAALPGFGGERRFYPWVSVIAARLCVDYHRNQARSEAVPDIDLGGVSGGEEAIVAAVDAELVTTAMSRLGPRHQDVLRLREVEGWSYRRIANHYQVPIGTIETLLFRARRALRREFDIIDGAGLMALPVIGWLVRGLARARDRFAPMASLSSAQSGLAVAAAVTATAAAVAIGVAPSHQPPVSRVTRAPEAVAPAGRAPATTTAPGPGEVSPSDPRPDSGVAGPGRPSDADAAPGSARTAIAVPTVGAAIGPPAVAPFDPVGSVPGGPAAVTPPTPLVPAVPVVPAVPSVPSDPAIPALQVPIPPPRPSVGDLITGPNPVTPAVPGLVGALLKGLKG